MEDFKAKIEYAIGREKKVLHNFSTQTDFEDWHLASLSRILTELGFYFFLDNKREMKNCKQYFNNAGLVDIFLTKKYSKSHSRFLEFDIPRCLIPLLSDNEKLIQSYAKIRFRGGENGELEMDAMVEAGELAIWCNTVQHFMANDREGVERNLNTIESRSISKLPKKEDGLKDDYEFYKALFLGNKTRMEEVLAKLVSPKVHKKRNDNSLLGHYVSLPALGYAKLAWRSGFEVEVNSSLVPKELLPIKPLDKYETPYDFLEGIIS